MLSGDKLAFVATALEGVIYGIFCAFCWRHLITWRKSTSSAHLLCPVVAFFILCTCFTCSDLAQEFLWVFRARSSYKDTEYAMFALNIVMSVVYASVNFISQGILIIRGWILWDRRRLLLYAPFLLAFTSFVTCIGLSVEKVFLHSQNAYNAPFWFYLMGIASFSISLGVSAIASAVIATKLLIHNASTSPSRPTRPRMQNFCVLLGILVDSGVVVTLVQAVWLALFVLQPEGFNAFGGSQVMIYAIAPTLILSRVIEQDALEEEPMTFAPAPLMRRYAPSPDWSLVEQNKVVTSATAYAIDDDGDSDSESEASETSVLMVEP